MKTKIYFRADGNSGMGLGHVIRSLALADMLKPEFECVFIIRNPLSYLRDRILEVCDKIIELPDFSTAKEEYSLLVKDYVTAADIVVLDGYHFNTEYQQAIKNIGSKLVCIDDIHTCHFVADHIINHAGGVVMSDYSAEPYTQYSLGPAYALLRKSFRVAAQNKSQRNANNNIFICLGGADPENATLDILKSCETNTSIDTCHLVIGAAFQYQKELKQYLSETRLNIQLYSSLSERQMAECMQLCSKAIVPPSTISYEYMSVGGEIYLKSIAENQLHMHTFMVNEGLAFDFHQFPESNMETIQETFLRQCKLFDGNQKKRFFRLFKSLTLDIRRASIDDCMVFFNWINDSETRQQSYNPEPIPLDNHITWFKKKIASQECAVYVVLQNNNPVGQIRFDISETEAIISYLTAKKYRGQGLGIGILRRGIAQFRREYTDKQVIVGFVKKDNIPSIKAFRSIGFTEQETDTFNNSYKYILK